MLRTFVASLLAWVFFSANQILRLVAYLFHLQPSLLQAGALVHVYTDGSVLVTHGGTEMGQGLHTKMVQVRRKEYTYSTKKTLVNETVLTERPPQ